MIPSISYGPGTFTKRPEPNWHIMQCELAWLCANPRACPSSWHIVPCWSNEFNVEITGVFIKIAFTFQSTEPSLPVTSLIVDVELSST